MMRALGILLLAVLLSVATLAGAGAGQPVAVRVGEHPGFSRVVFDWGGPVGVRLEQKAGQATIIFDRAGDIDLTRFKADPPRDIPDMAVVNTPTGTTAVIAMAAGARARLLEVDGVIAVDVLQADTPLDAPPAEPAKTAKTEPAKTEPAKTAPAKPEAKPVEAAAPPLAAAQDQAKAASVADATPAGVVQAPIAVPAPKPAPPPAERPAVSMATERTAATSPVEAVPISPLSVTPVAPAENSPMAENGPISLLPPTDAPPAEAGTPAGSTGASSVTAPASAPTLKPEHKPVVALAHVPRGRPLHHAPHAKPMAPVEAQSTPAQTAPAQTAKAEPAPAESRPVESPAAMSPAAMAAEPAAKVASREPGVSTDGSGSIAVIETEPTPARSIDRETHLPLRFDWPTEVAAAVYRRGPSLWLVFDHAPPRDMTADLARLAPQFGPYQQFEASGATLIRMAALPVLVPELRKEGAAWIVDLWSADRAEVPDIETTVDGAAQPPEVSFAMPDAGRVLSLQDPVLGDRIIVVPVTGAGHGLSQSREYPQFRALESYQGLVIQPFSEEIEVTLADGAARLRDTGGLVVSYGGNLARVDSNVPVPPTGPRLLDPEAWRHGAHDNFLDDKQELQTALSHAAPEEVGVARMNLARFFFGHGLSAETLGVLNLRDTSDPRLGADPQSRLMTGASEFLTDDFAAAAKDLFDPSLDGEWEADLWHAAYAAASHDWALAARRFARTEPLIAAYPHAVRTRLRLLAAEANLGIADTKAADRYLEQIRADSPDRAEEAQVAFLVGRRLQLEGSIDDAVAMWQRVLKSHHPPSQTRARVALLDLGLEQGTVSAEQAIQELERLRFAWRGDRFEFALLQRLGDLYIAQHEYRKGLRALRQAVAYFPDSAQSQSVAQRMRDVFVDLYLGKAATELPPLRALAMYEEFKELTPPGERGDQVVGSLVDRLVDVDLLGRASDLLTAQIKYRLDGLAKARAGTRLAMIRLLDRSPAKAIEAIELSAIPKMPADMERERRHLHARALSQLGDYDVAMSELGKDDDAEALRLRADILWAKKDWPAAAIALGRLVPAAPDPDKPLSADDSRRVMDLAVALTLSGDQEKLTALGKAYGEVMRTQPSAMTFALLVGDPQAGQTKSVAEELAQVAEVEAFMTNFRDRLKQQQAALPK